MGEPVIERGDDGRKGRAPMRIAAWQSGVPQERPECEKRIEFRPRRNAAGIRTADPACGRQAPFGYAPFDPAQGLRQDKPHSKET